MNPVQGFYNNSEEINHIKTPTENIISWGFSFQFYTMGYKLSFTIPLIVLPSALPASR
jgi:hypothetical protein